MEPKSILNLDNLPAEIVVQYLLRLNLKDLANYCQTSKRASEFCQSNEFWRDKYKYDFGSPLPKNPIKPWIDLYKKRMTIKNSPISAGENHYAVIDNQGFLYMAGLNRWGQLGDGTNNESKNPIQLRSFNRKVISVSCGNNFTMAITEDGKTYQWGFVPGFFIMFIGCYTGIPIPTLTDNLKNYKAVKVSCGGIGWGVILDNGSVYYSILVQFLRVEGIVSLEGGIMDISADTSKLAMVTNDGKLYFFGEYFDGELMGIQKVDGNWLIQPKLLKFLFPHKFFSKGVNVGKIKQVSLSDDHIMALSENGDVFTGGSNSDGQLGLETKKQKTHPGIYMELRKVIIPSKYIPTPKFSYIGSSDRISYSITVSGRLYVWGGSQYSLDLAEEKSPVEIDIGYRVNYITFSNIVYPISNITFSNDFAIAITEDGMVNYMGDPDYKQS